MAGWLLLSLCFESQPQNLQDGGLDEALSTLRFFFCSPIVTGRGGGGYIDPSRTGVSAGFLCRLVPKLGAGLGVFGYIKRRFEAGGGGGAVPVVALGMDGGVC